MGRSLQEKKPSRYSVTGRIAAYFCTFRPRVAVTVQSHAVNPQPSATLTKLRRPISGTLLRQIPKQHPLGGQVFE